MDETIDAWSVQILGSPGARSYEISVIHKAHERHHEWYGWGGERKHIICHNGGPCKTPMHLDIWNAQVELADRIATKWNGQGSQP